jgi:hypothetical protein
MFNNGVLSNQPKLTSVSSINLKLAKGASGLLCASISILSFGLALENRFAWTCLNSSRADRVRLSKAVVYEKKNGRLDNKLLHCYYVSSTNPGALNRDCSFYSLKHSRLNLTSIFRMYLNKCVDTSLLNLSGMIATDG